VGRKYKSLLLPCFFEVLHSFSGIHILLCVLSCGGIFIRCSCVVSLLCGCQISESLAEKSKTCVLADFCSLRTACKGTSCYPNGRGGRGMFNAGSVV